METAAGSIVFVCGFFLLSERGVVCWDKIGGRGAEQTLFFSATKIGWRHFSRPISSRTDYKVTP